MPLCEPAEAAVAHYLASRNEGAKTAAAGALAGLKKMNSAILTRLPLDKKSGNGWEAQVRGLRPNQQPPIAVAEAIHFEYIALTSKNPCLVLVAATAWLSLVGLIRDQHIQRSELVQTCANAYLFFCYKGKDRGKPFHWVIPKRTF